MADKQAEDESGDRSQAHRELLIPIASSARAPSIARHAVTELIRDHPAATAHLDALVLLVSEVVTNAVTHSGLPGDAEIELSVVVTDELTRVVISDQGKGFVQANDALQVGRTGGYGLLLLGAQASRWGTLNAPGRFSVWFELDHVPEPGLVGTDEDALQA